MNGILELDEVYTKLHVGYQERVVSATEARNAQKANINRSASKNDTALIDAIISHFICGVPTTWETK